VEVPVPSPKSQLYEFELPPVVLFMKETESDPHPVVGPEVVKLTCGALLTTTVCVAVSVHTPSVAINVTVNVFAEVYVYEGFCCVEVPVPSPKSQL
jgi:hypothetical protein